MAASSAARRSTRPASCAAERRRNSTRQPERSGDDARGHAERPIDPVDRIVRQARHRTTPAPLAPGAARRGRVCARAPRPGARSTRPQPPRARQCGAPPAPRSAAARGHGPRSVGRARAAPAHRPGRPSSRVALTTAVRLRPTAVGDLGVGEPEFVLAGARSHAPAQPGSRSARTMFSTSASCERVRSSAFAHECRHARQARRLRRTPAALAGDQLPAASPTPRTSIGCTTPSRRTLSTAPPSAPRRCARAAGAGWE